MVVRETFNQEAHDLETFSGRLNALVDLTGKYVSLADGRVAQLAQKFEVARSTMNFWLNANKIPPHQQLSFLVEALLIDIEESSVSLQSIQAWLVYGSAVPNPFLNAVPVSATSQDIAAVFRTILAQAKKIGILDIGSAIGESDSDHIVRTTLEVMLKNPPPRTPDPDLITRLLERAVQNKGR